MTKRLLARFSCWRHGHKLKHVENIHGDIINLLGYRSMWDCTHCGARITSMQLYYPPLPPQQVNDSLYDGEFKSWFRASKYSQVVNAPHLEQPAYDGFREGVRVAKQLSLMEVLSLHRRLASETLRADTGWERAENKARELEVLRKRLSD